MGATDIILLVCAIGGPIIIIIFIAWFKWQYSLFPLAMFSVFWIFWLIMPSPVPFELMDKIWWFVLMIGALAASFAIPLFIKWNIVQGCKADVARGIDKQCPTM